MTPGPLREIRRPPVARLPVEERPPLSVQLIVPVTTGLEFARIQQIVPDARIGEMDGGLFVLVAETTR
ncbi:MAG: hypothetical protein ACKOCM_08995, partial [Cyanobacteriota bacterium]